MRLGAPVDMDAVTWMERRFAPGDVEHVPCLGSGVAEEVIVGGVDPVIIGIDHGFSFPLGYMERYTISSWDQFHAGGPAGRIYRALRPGAF